MSIRNTITQYYTRDPYDSPLRAPPLRPTVPANFSYHILPSDSERIRARDRFYREASPIRHQAIERDPFRPIERFEMPSP